MLFQKRILSTMLWCYPQHRLSKLCSSQIGKPEWFRNAFRKVQTTWKRTRRSKSKIFPVKAIFLCLSNENNIFFCHFGNIWHCWYLISLHFWASESSPMRPHVENYAESSSRNNNVLKQNLFVKYGLRTSLSNLYYLKFIGCHWQLRYVPTNSNYQSNENNNSFMEWHFRNKVKKLILKKLDYLKRQY